MSETNFDLSSSYLAKQQALLAITRQIQQRATLREILELILLKVEQLLNLAWGGIYQFKDNLEKNSDQLIAQTGKFPPCLLKQGEPLETLEGIGLLKGLNKIKLDKNYPYSFQPLNLPNLIGVPIYQTEELWGLLLIYSSVPPHEWQQEDSFWVQQIALSLGIALQQDQMYQQQQQQSERLTQAVEGAVEREKTVAKIIDKIRRSLDLETIFTTATQEVRQLLNSDRVAIYRFNHDWSGKIISDSVGQGWTSLVEKQCQYPMVDPNMGQCQVRSLCNPQLTDTYLKAIEGKIFNPNNLVRVCNNIYEAGFSPCYIEILEEYEAKAYIIVAIYHQDTLWGLLAAYQNANPRQWQDEEINFLVQIGANLGIALDQAQLLNKTRQNQEKLETSLAIALREQKETLAKIAEKERSLSTVIDKIRLTLDLTTIFQTAATEVQKLLEVEHIAIYQFETDGKGRFIFESDPGPFPSVVGQLWDDQFLQQHHSCVINDIKHDQDCCQDQINPFKELGVMSLVMVPLFQGEDLWGLLTAFQHTSSRHWPETDVQLLEQVAHHLSIALQQTHYLQQIRDYAKEQARAVQQEKALSQVIDKIRRTLDLETIFKTTATEVRQLLEADRVAVFQFDPNSHWTSGQFVSEDVSPEFDSALEAKVEDHCFGENHANYYQQGQILAHDDIYQQGLLECHIAILSRFQVRANLVAPLIKGQQLWGLLCIHQCSGPRQWQTSEKEFVAKIANHLGVALQQAQLLQETQQRSQDLQKALEQVKQQKGHLAQVAAQDRALARVIERIRQTLDLETIFSTTTQEVRQMLKCDRVVVYRFNPDWGGEFLYESVGEGWTPLTGESAEQPLWNDTYLQEHQGGRYRYNELFAVDDIYQANLTPCHVELLIQFQVNAFVVVPVFVGDRLWGLLAIYQNSAPRFWEKREIELLKQLANQLGVAVHQSQLLTQTQQQSETLQNTVADLNAIVDNLGDGLIVIDIYGQITRYNRALTEMFNLKDSPQGQHLLEVFPPVLATLLKPIEPDQQKVVTVEVELAQGKIGQALISKIIQGSYGQGTQKCIGAVILIRDVTAEREIEQIKNDFLATVSHELRTPLTSVWALPP
ncbi:putative PAS/PAC sensor protein [Rippkaea orientalis PCC 8801]|uniref:histidine kinase n=1 Tax=Rippkaea orientalis (strain PCC 8801 / RF-1) TaxID=41431 RepID=B7JWR5_RIPO1|nr:GAF domain-containing protein [Rippkaea orientalis]ACK65764.1 putative PAS/PAC sensor protein [Rippkaea orientalis PCC 8801]